MSLCGWCGWVFHSHQQYTGKHLTFLPPHVPRVLQVVLGPAAIAQAPHPHQPTPVVCSAGPDHEVPNAFLLFSGVWLCSHLQSLHGAEVSMHRVGVLNPVLVSGNGPHTLDGHTE